MAAKTGKFAILFPAKSSYYLGGLTEGFEVIVLFGLLCMFPAAFFALAFTFAAACDLTTVLRRRHGWRMFGEDERRM